MKNSKIIYSINVQDVQTVANRVLKRPLNNKEIASIENSIGNHIDWFQAIENAIDHLTFETSHEEAHAN